MLLFGNTKQFGLGTKWIVSSILIAFMALIHCHALASGNQNATAIQTQNLLVGNIYGAPADFVALDSRHFVRRLHTGVYYFEDPEDKLTAEQITSLEMQSKFSRYDLETLHFGYSASTYWLRFVIKNRMSTEQEATIDLRYPLIDEVDFYVVSHNGDVQTSKMGDHRNFKDRAYRVKNYLQRVPLLPNEEKVVFLRVKSQSSLSLPLFVTTESSFVETLAAIQMGDGAYFGLAAGLLLYNLFLCFLIKERIYLEYCGFVLFHIGFVFCLSGYPQVVMPENVFMTERAVYVFGLVSGVCLYQFCRSYLHTLVDLPRVDNGMKVYMVLAILAAVAEMFVPLTLAIKLNALTVLFGTLILFLIGTYRFFQRYRPARYFIVGQGAVLSSVVFTALSSLNIVPGYFLAPLVMKLASVLELIFFSVGLADRINVMKSQQVVLDKQAQVAQAENQARKRYISEINNINQELEKAIKSRSQFLANMSHEIRTPMNGILGMLELIDDNSLDSMQKNYIEIARRSGKTLMALINDVLDLSKIESGKLELEQQPIDIRQLLEDLGHLYSHQIEDKRLEFITHVDSSLPKYILGDRTRLWQVLTNLVSNSIKFTPKGKVSVTLKLVDGENALLRFSVHDTGVGIPVDKQNAIFESFTQADGSTTRQFGGTGLGLTISRKLVQMMQGELEVDSYAGGGSTFFFSIPMLEAQAPRLTEQPETQEESIPDIVEFNDTAALLVEDNVVNQKVALGMLRKLGIETVEVVDNGADAVRLVAKQHYDVVFMDVQMPVMDGYEATQRIREHEKKHKAAPVLIVAMTAHSMEGDRELCIEAGMNDYISKPIQKADIKSVLSKYLSKTKSTDARQRVG